jgi:hypothetical protein
MERRPNKYKSKFRVTVTMDATFVVWADSAEQVGKAMSEADKDEIFIDTEPDVHVDESPDTEAEQVHSAVVSYNDDDPPEWLNLADMPWAPVEDPKLDDDYTPSPEELEASGQKRLKL